MYHARSWTHDCCALAYTWLFVSKFPIHPHCHKYIRSNPACFQVKGQRMIVCNMYSSFFGNFINLLFLLIGLFNFNRKPLDESFGLTFKICRSNSNINWHGTIQESENKFKYEARGPPLEIERIMHKPRTLADGDADARGVRR